MRLFQADWIWGSKAEAEIGSGERRASVKKRGRVVWRKRWVLLDRKQEAAKREQTRRESSN